VSCRVLGVKRVYDEPDAADGTRVLVDRLWPRGLAKSGASIDQWCKEVAPTTGLRQWYGHDPDRFGEFRRRYLQELADRDHDGAVARLRALAAGGTLTLLTATREVHISAAAVLAEHLQRR